jgi:hypothetical protein
MLCSGVIVLILLFARTSLLSFSFCLLYLPLHLRFSFFLSAAFSLHPSVLRCCFFIFDYLPFLLFSFFCLLSPSLFALPYLSVPIGELLVSVQLIPTLGRSIPKPKENPSIFEVPTRNAFIEFLVIGIRDMAPFNYQPMQAPFISVELNSFGSKFKSQTASSKKPEPANPNYLEKLIMPVVLPENALFSSPLQIKAHDTRLGGYLKPIVGVCQIDMTNKMPWCEKYYIPPAHDLFYQDMTDMAKKTCDADAGMFVIT